MPGKGVFSLDTVIKFISSAVTHFLGTQPKFLYALLLLMSLDYITGVCAAIREKRVSSKIGIRGITMKVMVFVIVAVSAVVDRLLLDGQYALSTVTLLFYCSNEAISILENASKMGIPLPAKLRQILSDMREQEKSEKK